MDFNNTFRYSLNNKALVAIVLGVVLLVNILSLQFFFRVDATRNQQYTISDATVDVLEQLDDLVSIKLYFSPDLPAQLLTAEQYIKDIVSEYQAYGSGNVDVSYVDLSTATAQQEAQQSGVQRVEMQVLEDDSFQVRNGYFGLTVAYEGELEVIPVLQEQNLGNLEYDLTSLILKLSQPRLQVVSFLQGHGEHGITRPLVPSADSARSDYSLFADALRQNYEVNTVDVSAGQGLDGTDVLIVAGPQQDLTERARFELDQYLLNGGNALFLLDTVELQPGAVTVTPYDNGLSTLLEPLGVTVNADLVLDQLAEFANFEVSPGRTFIVPYPFFIQLVQKNFSDHPVVQKIAALTVRFASSLNISEVDGLEYDAFLNTSPASWTQSGPQFQTNPNAVPQPTEADLGSQTIAVSVQGMMPRLSTAETIPLLEQWVENEEGEMNLEAVSDDPLREGREVLTEATADSQVIVVSDSDFISDAYVNPSSPALVVGLNMVDYLTFGDALISIRAKSLGDAPLDDLDSGTRSLMRFIGILLMPILVCAYGFFRLWMRRKEERLLNL